MRNLVSIWLPRWSIDRLRRQRLKKSLTSKQSAKSDKARAARPFALIEDDRRGSVIAATNSEAESEGVRVGMTLSDARALYPTLRVRAIVPADDRKALNRLARWATRFTPLVTTWEGHVADEYGLLLDVGGCEHLFGGAAAMMVHISKQLDEFGFSHQMGMAPLLSQAWACSRFFQEKHYCLENDQDLLKLPIEALRLDDASNLTMRRLGLKTLGDIVTLPRSGLERRFSSPRVKVKQGLETAAIHRLDQMFGRCDEPLSPILPAPVFRAHMRFIEPIISDEAIDVACESLVDDLCQKLESENEAVRRLSLCFYGLGGETKRVTVGLASPTREREHIARVLREKIAQYTQNIIFEAGVDVMVLSADVTESTYDLFSYQQKHFETLISQTDDTYDTTAVNRLIDRLTVRLGASRVGQIVQRDSHIPERAQKHQGLADKGFVTPANRVQSEENSGGLTSSSHLDFPAHMSKSSSVGRPIRIFSRPEPIDVMAQVPDGAPLQFQWRRQRIKVRAASGPERISAEWWQDASHHKSEDTRDYFKVEGDNGQRFWLFRDGLYRGAGVESPPQWYIHGQFA